MKGTIELIGPRQGMIGVRTEADRFSVLELLGGYAPEIGDVLSGGLEDLGSETVRNVTQEEDWDVYIQDKWGSKESAWRFVSQH